MAAEEGLGISPGDHVAPDSMLPSEIVKIETSSQPPRVNPAELKVLSSSEVGMELIIAATTKSTKILSLYFGNP